MRGRAVAVAFAAFAALCAAGCTIDTRVASFSGDGGAADAGRARFITLRAGALLPDETTCARLVTKKPEVRPQNVTPNNRVATPAEVGQLTPWDNAHSIVDDRALTLQARVTGDFAGTTDEILQWVACKWGFDEDLVRAEAFEQTAWIQNVHTDWTTTSSLCPPDAATRTQNGTLECAQTYGMLQVVWQYHKSSWPMLRDSTAFHLDFVYGLRRVCFEGWDTSQGTRLGSPDHPYTKDDELGCLGAHYSGRWYDDGANAYISRVQGQLLGRGWEKLATM